MVNSARAHGTLPRPGNRELQLNRRECVLPITYLGMRVEFWLFVAHDERVRLVGASQIRLCIAHDARRTGVHEGFGPELFGDIYEQAGAIDVNLEHDFPRRIETWTRAVDDHIRPYVCEKRTNGIICSQVGVVIMNSRHWIARRAYIQRM